MNADIRTQETGAQRAVFRGAGCSPPPALQRPITRPPRPAPLQSGVRGPPPCPPHPGWLGAVGGGRGDGGGGAQVPGPLLLPQEQVAACPRLRCSVHSLSSCRPRDPLRRPRSEFKHGVSGLRSVPHGRDHSKAHRHSGGHGSCPRTRVSGSCCFIVNARLSFPLCNSAKVLY